MSNREIAQRLAALSDLLGVSAREIDRRAIAAAPPTKKKEKEDEKSEGHLTMLIRRLNKDESASAHIDTLRNFAAAAGTTLAWIDSGEGRAPRDPELEKACPEFFDALNGLESELSLRTIVDATAMARRGRGGQRGTWVTMLLDLEKRPILEESPHGLTGGRDAESAATETKKTPG